MRLLSGTNDRPTTRPPQGRLADDAQPEGCVMVSEHGAPRARRHALRRPRLVEDELWRCRRSARPVAREPASSVKIVSHPRLLGQRDERRVGEVHRMVAVALHQLGARSVNSSERSSSRSASRSTMRQSASCAAPTGGPAQQVDRLGERRPGRDQRQSGARRVRHGSARGRAPLRRSARPEGRRRPASRRGDGPPAAPEGLPGACRRPPVERTAPERRRAPRSAGDRASLSALRGGAAQELGDRDVLLAPRHGGTHVVELGVQAQAHA